MAAGLEQPATPTLPAGIPSAVRRGAKQRPAKRRAKSPLPKPGGPASSSACGKRGRHCVAAGVVATGRDARAAAHPSMRSSHSASTVSTSPAPHLDRSVGVHDPVAVGIVPWRGFQINRPHPLEKSTLPARSDPPRRAARLAPADRRPAHRTAGSNRAANPLAPNPPTPRFCRRQTAPAALISVGGIGEAVAQYPMAGG
jgi:hypothetical protein